MVTVKDIGWAAGFYEGEGNISSNQYGTVYVSILQKDPEPLLKIQKLFGGKISVTKTGYNRIGMSGVKMRGFILTIFSLLSHRRKQQILKHKESFTTPDACPGGHEYVEGSYKIVTYDGRSYKQCIECRKMNIERKNEKRRNENWEEKVVKQIAKARKVSMEEASKIWEAQNRVH